MPAAAFADPFGKPAPAQPTPPPANDPGDTPGYEAALEHARKLYAEPGNTGALAFRSGALLGAGPDVDSTLVRADFAVENLIDAAQGKHNKITSDEAARAVKRAAKEALEKYGKDHPIGAAAVDFAGGLATPGVGWANDAMKLRKVPGAIRAAAIGGGLGGGRGVFDSEGRTPGDRVAQTGESIGEGAAGGALLHGAGKLAGSVLGRAAPAVGGMLGTARERFGGKGLDPAAREAKGREIGRGMVQRRADARDPTRATLKRNPAEAAGKDVTAAEALGRHDVGRLGGAGKHESPNADALVARVAARNEGTGERIADHVAKVANLDKDAIEGDFEATNKQLRAQAAPLYAEWHANTNVDSPELQTVRATPAFKKAMAKAAEIIANEHGNATEEGLAPAELPLEWKGKPMIDRSTGKPLMVPREQALSHAQSSGVPHSMGGEIEQEPVPTARGYDYVKRGFDALINAHKDQVTGRIDFSNPDVKALVGLRSELNGALTDESKPWGGSAKAAYAAGGEAPMQEEAFGATSRVMSAGVSDHDFEKAIGRYTPAQMDALRAGVANMFRDLSRGKGVRIGAFLNPNAETKIKRIFGQHAGEAIIRDLRTEAEMGRTGKQLSPKASAAGEKFDEDIQRHASEWYHMAMAGQDALEFRPVQAVIHLARGLASHAAKFIETPEGKAANDEVVRLLGMKPSELAAELDRTGATPAQKAKTSNLLDAIRKSGMADGLAGKAAGVAASSATNFYGQTFGDKKESPPAAATKPDDAFEDPFGKDATDAVKPTKADYSEPPAPHAPNSEVSGYLENTLGVPVTITSGYRDPDHNAEVGGAPGSAHMKGEAWDFQPHGMSMEDAGFRLAHSGIPFDQIEITPTHVHVSFAPQMRGLVIQHGFGGRQAAADMSSIAAMDQPDFPPPEPGADGQ